MDWEKTKGVVLTEGKHATREEGMCALEYASFLAGGEHTDDPSCVNSRIREFIRQVNDGMSPEDREKLKDLLPNMIGTNTPEFEEKALRLIDKYGEGDDDDSAVVIHRGQVGVSAGKTISREDTVPFLKELLG